MTERPLPKSPGAAKGRTVPATLPHPAPPPRQRAAGGAEPGRLPRRRGPRGGLRARGSALPFSGAGGGKKEVPSLSGGEKPPAGQGDPAPAARVPAGEPAKGCVSPSTLPPPPPPAPVSAEDNRLAGKWEQGGRAAAPGREEWGEASLPLAL